MSSSIPNSVGAEVETKWYSCTIRVLYRHTVEDRMTTNFCKKWFATMNEYTLLFFQTELLDMGNGKSTRESLSETALKPMFGAP